MLAAIIKSTGQKTIADETNKTDGPFMCADCGSEAILKQGRITTAHFAHKPPSQCEYSQGESELHRQCKKEIYTALCRFDWMECELEKHMGIVRPDIYIKLSSGEECAIEVQISTLSMDKIIYRTEQYSRLGVHALWLPVLAERRLRKSTIQYAPSSWEKWLHALYFGRVYYWVGDLNIQPIHFDDYYLHVPENDYGGGYHKKSKRYRVPIWGDLTTFPRNFSPIGRNKWQGGNVYIPTSRIMLDRQESWW